MAEPRTQRSGVSGLATAYSAALRARLGRERGAMQYQVTHTTAYQYSEPVSLCHNLAHLTPREAPGQQCLHSALSILPQPAVLSERTDYFGNPCTFFAVQEPHRELIATAAHHIRLAPRPLPDPAASPP